MMLNQHVMVSTWSHARWYLVMVSTRQTQQNKKFGFLMNSSCVFLCTKKSMRSTSIFLTRRCYLLKVWGFGSPKEKSDPSRHARTTKQRFQTCLATYQQIIISRAKTNLLMFWRFHLVFKLLFFQLSSFQASSIFVFVDRGIGARRHKLSSCHNPISACMASVATVNSQPDFLKPNSPDLTFTLSASNWVLPTHC